MARKVCAVVALVVALGTVGSAQSPAVDLAGAYRVDGTNADGTTYRATVTIAANGEIALQQLQRENANFDLVLMDCEMPLLDGYSAAQRYREYERQRHLPHLPIIALTAHVLQEHQTRTQQAGMDDHIGKPLEFTTLKEKLLERLAPDRKVVSRT